MFSVYFAIYFSSSFYIKEAFKLRTKIEAKNKKAEKRKSARKLEYLNFEFCLLNPLHQAPPYTANMYGRTTDISENGIGLTTDFPIEADQKIVCI